MENIQPPYEADRDISRETQQSVCGLKGCCGYAGFVCTSAPSGCRWCDPSVQHLRPISVSGQAHTAHDLRTSWAAQPLPVYGDGLQIRDWLFVDDHCRAILAVLEHGRVGEAYNVGGNCALSNVK